MISPVLRIALFILSAAPLALGQVVDNILASTATFAPTVTVSDRYSERIVAEIDGRDVFRSQEANAESIAVKVVANLAGAVTGVINAQTSVGVTAGYFDHTATLGEASDYRPGSRRATFPLINEVGLENGNIRAVRVGTVLYTWTATTMTVTVTCTDVEGAGVGDVAASDYVGLADAGTSLGIVDEPIDVYVVFGDATGSRQVYLRGLTRTYTRGFGTGDNYESFDLCEVTLQGAADVDSPVVKPVFPAKPNALNKLDITGTATDLTEMRMGGVTVNSIPVPVNLVVPSIATGGFWSVRNVQLKKGVNKVQFDFWDEDSNLTRITKSYTIR